MAIPVIDFSKTEGEERAQTLAQIAHCCEEWGFFQLMNHGISEELLERVKKVASECYKLEREAIFEESKPVKMLKELSDDGERIDDVDWEDVFLLTDDNHHHWPSKTPHFKETMKEYRGELKKLGERVMEAMDETLGLPIGYMKRAFDGENKAFFGTKVSHYPPCPQPEKVNALRAHTDAEDDEVEALQILKDGAWIDVQPLKNAIVINTGDQVEVLSNGRYKSVWHRIVAKKRKATEGPLLRSTIHPWRPLSSPLLSLLSRKPSILSLCLEITCLFMLSRSFSLRSPGS